MTQTPIRRLNLCQPARRVRAPGWDGRGGLPSRICAATIRAWAAIYSHVCLPAPRGSPTPTRPCFRGVLVAAGAGNAPTSDVMRSALARNPYVNVYVLLNLPPSRRRPCRRAVARRRPRAVTAWHFLPGPSRRNRDCPSTTMPCRLARWCRPPADTGTCLYPRTPAELCPTCAGAGGGPDRHQTMVSPATNARGHWHRRL